MAIAGKVIVLGAALVCLTVSQKIANCQTGDSKQTVPAELTSKVDTKSAKVGDPVAATTLADATTKDGLPIPKGTKVVGKVVEVQPKSAGNATLGIEFTELDEKDGKRVPVHGILIAIIPEPDSDANGGSMPLASTRSSAGFAGVTGFNQGAGTGSDLLRPGSSLKGITLDTTVDASGAAALHSAKDIKLEHGMQVAIGLL